jgi:co-chaperonin GroES (HSP10)
MARRVLFNLIMIELEQHELQRRASSAGLYLTSESEEKYQGGSSTGIIVEMGPTCYRNHKAIPENCEGLPQVGDRVLFSRYAGTDEFINGKRYKFMYDDKPLMILDKDDTVGRAEAE